MKNLGSVSIALVFLCLWGVGYGASSDSTSVSEQPKLLIPLNDERSRWIAFHTYIQLWARHTQTNPGSTVFDRLEETTNDISVRRFRLGLRGQLTERLFTYLQIGVNNLNYLSSRGTSVDLLDAYAEYRFAPQFTLGGGKTAWTGLSRYTAPNTSRLMTYDIFFLPMPTVNELNDLLRKFSIFAKGKVGRLDYRLVGSKPFSVEGAEDFDPIPEEDISKFRDNPSSPQLSGYFKWEFWDQETNQIPFSDGTYLGEKRVLNLGFGFDHHSNSLWHLQNGDTVLNDLQLWALDLFWEQPFQQGRTAFTFYSAYYNYQLGPNFIRNVGANNPANGVDPDLASFNGEGNAFPVVGTGSSLLSQAGYLLPNFQESGKGGRLQPYLAIQYSSYERLDDPVLAYDFGINWLIQGHHSKLSLNLQNRPIFFENATGINVEERKWMYVLQYIIRID